MGIYKEGGKLSYWDLRGISKSLLFLLIFAIVLLVIFLLVNSRSSNGADEDLDTDTAVESEDVVDVVTSEEEEGIDEDPVVYEDSITVDDQDAGDSVFITSMSLSESRWVVIHEDSNGELGNILGARLFPKEAEQGEVSLLRGTEKGESYYAVLYLLAEREEDVGRRFDTDRDLPLVKEGGEIKMVLFSVE